MTTTVRDEAREQTMSFLAHPREWGLWPFLPLVRRSRGCLPTNGVLFDAMGSRSMPGFEHIVFLVNVYELPETLGRLLAMPKEVYTSAEQILDAGWVVD